MIGIAHQPRPEDIEDATPDALPEDWRQVFAEAAKPRERQPVTLSYRGPRCKHGHELTRGRRGQLVCRTCAANAGRASGRAKAARRAA